MRLSLQISIFFWISRFYRTRLSLISLCILLIFSLCFGDKKQTPRAFLSPWYRILSSLYLQLALFLLKALRQSILFTLSLSFSHSLSLSLSHFYSLFSPTAICFKLIFSSLYITIYWPTAVLFLLSTVRII